MPEISTETTPTAAALEWVPIPAEIVRLGGSALVAWARIAAAGQVDPYDPSRITSTVGLADLDLSDTTARNAVHRLESTGLVIVDRAPGKPSTYTLTRGDRWAQLPTTLVDLDPGPMAAYCSLYLAGTFESAHRNTTVRRLAAWLGAGLRTVRRWISELVASGALKRHGDYAYTLTPPPPPPQEPPPNLAANESKTKAIPRGAVKKQTTDHKQRRPKWIEEVENAVRPRIPEYTPPEPMTDRATPEAVKSHIATMRAALRGRAS